MQDRDEATAALLHATSLGVFESSWNVVCADCHGVLDAERHPPHRRA